MNNNKVCVRSENKAELGYFARLKREFSANKSVYFMALVPVIWYIVFCYIPMGGILIAFQKYNMRLGILGSPWVGLRNFERFFSDPYFVRSLRNTVVISLSSIIFSFPLPIIFALLLNELNHKWFMKSVQTVTYIPYFISLVVLCGMVRTFVSDDGIVTRLIEAFCGADIKESLLNKPNMFTAIFVGSGIWQGVGWSSIIYTAAISGIDQELYEAASIDGATRFQKVIHVMIPSIVQTIVVLFILRLGSALTVDYQKILLLINQLNAEKAEVLSYFIYQRGLVNSDYSLSTAAGLFNSVINLALVWGANALSRKVSEIALW